MNLQDLSQSLPFDLPGLAYRHARFDPSAAPDRTHPLPPALQTAIPRRQSEFLAGRACAAFALGGAGSPVLTVDINPDRSPVWPAGFVGSISHAGTEVCAVAANKAQYSLLGLDLERLMPDAQAVEIADIILTREEARLRPATMTHAQFVTLVFSAKESLYKAIYPKLQRILDFHEVTLTAVSPQTVDLVLNTPPPNLPARYRAHAHLAADHWLTLVAV